MSQERTEWRVPDVLSEEGARLLGAGAGARYERLVVRGEEPGGHLREAKRLLAGLTPERLLAGEVKSREDARALVAGVYLYYDLLDESHRVSQDLHTPTGSFWHAIMHRREGDFSNSKYWYAKCHRHPALGEVAALARAALARGSGDRSEGVPLDRLARLAQGEWDPGAFVDVVEAVHETPEDPLFEPALRLQQAEWWALFDYCARGAAGRK